MDAATQICDIENKTDEFSSLCLERAKLIGDWCIANQINDRFEPTYGEYVANYHPTEKFFNGKNELMSGGMMTAMSVNFLFMLYDRTNDIRYFDAAIRCGEYLKSLQYLYSGKTELYGCVGEFSIHQLGPKAEHFCYRSTTVVGDAFVLLFRETQDQEYLDRAKLIADWFIKYALADEGWVVDNDKRPGVLDVRYYFQIANILFFYHLYKYDSDPRYLKVIKTMGDYYLNNFINEDGLSKMVLDEPAFEKHLGSDEFARRWWRMHVYNDDFSNIALMCAARILDDDRYFEPAQRFADWLLDEQNYDGSIGEPAVWVASATSTVLWQDMFLETGEHKYHDASAKALKHLMTLQELSSGNVRQYGGVYGNNEVINAICARMCNYCPVALLKYESCVVGPYLSVFDKDGKYYI
ncbi:MAG: hypothetical protein ACIAQZ_09865 [Sedimentisphaeraceae bacterium JB056]